MPTLTITKENFETDVLQQAKPILIDFWAPWCSPCRMIAPVLDELAAQQDDFIVAKVNVDNDSELAMQFGVMSIPLLVLLKDGKEVARSEGLKPNQKQVILEMAAPYLNGET